jgi:hypothetical protein
MRAIYAITMWIASGVKTLKCDLPESAAPMLQLLAQQARHTLPPLPRPRRANLNNRLTNNPPRDGLRLSDIREK